MKKYAVKMTETGHDAEAEILDNDSGLIVGTIVGSTDDLIDDIESIKAEPETKSLPIKDAWHGEIEDEHRAQIIPELEKPIPVQDADGISDLLLEDTGTRFGDFIRGEIHEVGCDNKVEWCQITALIIAKLQIMIDDVMNRGIDETVSQTRELTRKHYNETLAETINAFNSDGKES